MNLWPHLYFLVQECMCVSVLLQAQPSGDYGFLGLRRCTVRLEDKGTIIQSASQAGMMIRQEK